MLISRRPAVRDYGRQVVDPTSPDGLRRTSCLIFDLGERFTLERKMNLHEETERTENEAIALISLLTHEVSGP